MRRFALLLLLAGFPLASSACSEAPAADTRTAAISDAAAGPLQPIALRVPDMSCGICAKPIEAKLREMGVRDVKADLKTKWVTGKFDPDRITPEIIRAKVEELKFAVAEVRVG